MNRTNPPLAYAHFNRTRFVRELQEFVRFPSVSARPEHAFDLVECAEWLANHLRSIGLKDARVIPTGGHPLVYAEHIESEELPTVLIYGHYDVQPVEPLDQWVSSPFDPVIRGDDLYGRGASDDKGQMLAHIKALEAHLQTTGRLPVNVRCLFEGEEEIGSPNFEPFIRDHRGSLSAEVVLISDTTMPGPTRPALTYAMRGALSLELTLSGPKTELHDGQFGGAFANPLQGLCEIISALYDKHGRISIPGFYDRVSDIGLAERDYMASNGPSDEDIMQDAQTQRTWGERGYSLYERTTVRPSLTVSGLKGGYEGPGPKAIIPTQAVAKLNFRLVPDQNPEEVEEKVRRHIARLTPFNLSANVRTLVAAKPVLLDTRNRFLKGASVAAEKIFGTAPVFLRSGGTNPAVGAFHHTLELPVALLGLALRDDHIHAPNEKFHLPNFYRGIATSICFLGEVRKIAETSDAVSSDRFVGAGPFRRCLPFISARTTQQRTS